MGTLEVHAFLRSFNSIQFQLNIYFFKSSKLIGKTKLYNTSKLLLQKILWDGDLLGAVHYR